MAVAPAGETEENVLGALNVAVAKLDAAGRVQAWNRGCERYTGWREDEVLGRPLVEVVAGPNEVAWIEAVLAETRAVGLWEGRVDVRRRDGSAFSTRTQTRLQRDASDGPCAITVVCVDISDQLRSERRLRSAEAHLQSIVDNMNEGLLTFDGEGRLTSLNPAAERMLGYRYEQLAGRVAHDVIHPACNGRLHAFDHCPMSRAALADRILRVEDDVFFRADGSALPVSYTTSSYTAEDGTRGSAVIFRDISERKAEEVRLQRKLDALRWVSRIRAGLDEDRFALHAQPIIDLRTGRIAKHELLLRLCEPDGTIVLPGDFLPAAEEHGLIHDIDRWVIGEALRYAARGLTVEFNLSARSIGSCAMLQEFAHQLAATGADPSRIVIELTETALLANESMAARFLATVKGLGCKIALDDFGTGYGGFSYLKRLPVDYLKIDMEFVSDLVTNEASRHVVQAVVNLAAGFGQKTVAEGAEDKETLDLLAGFGVDYAQGYVVSRPGPADQLLSG